jgi:SNF2 family DNA or RNA helicase
MTLRNLRLKKLYHGVDAARDEFLIPGIINAIEYKRGAGYFSVGSLLSISQGLEELIRKNGKFSLLIGLHDVPPELMEAQRLVDYWNQSDLISKRLSELLDEVRSLSNALEINRVETIALALRDRFLEVKLAKPLSTHSLGIFHIKRIILKDENGDFVVATGSPNETVGGLAYNFEDLTVFNSWDDSRDYAHLHLDAFQQMWTGQHPDLEIYGLDDDFVNQLLDAVNQARKNIDSSPKTSPDNLKSQDTNIRELINAIRKTIPFIPFSFSGTRLLPHQEFAYAKGLSRWPVRVLLGDEVGLGKTIEMGSIVSYLLTTKSINSVMILAPKNLMVQLQDELFEKFGLNFYRWESGTERFISCDKKEISGRGVSPGGIKAPKLTLVSAQWARGSNRRSHIFTDIQAPVDLLVVDEAHSARKPPKGSKHAPTLMYRMLKDASEKVSHLVLLTATPMQIYIEEYLGLLEILGAPYPWTDVSHFTASLDISVNNEDRVPLEQANMLLKLIKTALPTLNSDTTLARRLSEITEVASKGENQVIQASKIRSKWTELKSSLIEVNPASNLTVRNTRKSLERMGYEFPERQFESPNLRVSTEIASFQSKMEDYLRNAYASVESAINPSYEGSKGFVICVYQQRIASSLYSAEMSLTRRRMKLEQIKLGVSQELSLEDEDLLDESHEVEEVADLPVEVQVRARVQNAASRELNYLNDLLDELRNVEGGTIDGDPKIASLLKYLDEVTHNSKVIVFSRYTDTLQGIIKAFESTDNLRFKIAIGFYTGSEVWIRNTNGNKVLVSKKVLKQSLEQGEISVIFCSDAASEGLNLQAANKLVNIDVPWNPGRLEQRIGRIARLGQKAKTVEIVNYWYPGSVESRMYSRLLERRDLYEMAIGPFPQIFSSAIKDAVLSGMNGTPETRDPLLQLEELRDNLHRLALEDLWGASHPSDSKSRKIVAELDEILGTIKESKETFGLCEFDFDSESETTGVLANPCWDELRVTTSAKESWNSIFAIKSRNQFWYFAIQEGQNLIPVPLTSLPSLVKAAIGIKKLVIPTEWRANSWTMGDRPKDSLEWEEDFLLIPKHDAFHPITDVGLIGRNHPIFDHEELQVEVVGQALIGEKNEG